MTPEPDSQDLLQRFRAGDTAATSELFDRYLGRLLALARSRISPKLARRVDPEDIVQSAYRSFFLRAATDRITLRRAGDLWRLLAAFTINKLRGQVEFHAAQQRAIDRERDAQDLVEQAAQRAATSNAPGPVEVAALEEGLQDVMARLTPLERHVLQLRLQGTTVREISCTVERSERTVRRLLGRMRGVFVQRLLDGEALEG